MEVSMETQKQSGQDAGPRLWVKLIQPLYKRWLRRKAREPEPDPLVFKNLAEIEIKSGDWQLALDNLNEAANLLHSKLEQGIEVGTSARNAAHLLLAKVLLRHAACAIQYGQFSGSEQSLEKLRTELRHSSPELAQDWADVRNEFTQQQLALLMLKRKFNELEQFLNELQGAPRFHSHTFFDGFVASSRVWIKDACAYDTTSSNTSYIERNFQEAARLSSVSELNNLRKKLVEHAPEDFRNIVTLANACIDQLNEIGSQAVKNLNSSPSEQNAQDECSPADYSAVVDSEHWDLSGPPDEISLAERNLSKLKEKLRTAEEKFHRDRGNLEREINGVKPLVRSRWELVSVLVEAQKKEVGKIRDRRFVLSLSTTIKHWALQTVRWLLWTTVVAVFLGWIVESLIHGTLEPWSYRLLFVDLVLAAIAYIIEENGIDRGFSQSYREDVRRATLDLHEQATKRLKGLMGAFSSLDRPSQTGQNQG